MSYVLFLYVKLGLLSQHVYEVELNWIVVIIIINLVTTVMQGIYNYIPKITVLVYSVPAALYLNLLHLLLLLLLSSSLSSSSSSSSSLLSEQPPQCYVMLLNYIWIFFRSILFNSVTLHIKNATRQKLNYWVATVVFYEFRSRIAEPN